jgi:hypothetical protein
MADLLILGSHHDELAEGETYTIYHINIPVGQARVHMACILAPALGVRFIIVIRSSTGSNRFTNNHFLEQKIQRHTQWVFWTPLRAYGL